MFCGGGVATFTRLIHVLLERQDSYDVVVVFACKALINGCVLDPYYTVLAMQFFKNTTVKPVKPQCAACVVVSKCEPGARVYPAGKGDHAPYSKPFPSNKLCLLKKNKDTIGATIRFIVRSFHLIVISFHNIARTFHDSLRHKQKQACPLSKYANKAFFTLSFELKLWNDLTIKLNNPTWKRFDLRTNKLLNNNNDNKNNFIKNSIFIDNKAN